MRNLADISDGPNKNGTANTRHLRKVRLREKGKLKHGQHKLKEHIEQLRGMDGSAFLTLPVSPFRPPGTSASPEGDEPTDGPTTADDDTDAGSQVLPGIHVNEETLHNEGE